MEEAVKVVVATVGVAVVLVGVVLLGVAVVATGAEVVEVVDVEPDDVLEAAATVVLFTDLVSGTQLMYTCHGRPCRAIQ